MKHEASTVSLLAALRPLRRVVSTPSSVLVRPRPSASVASARRWQERVRKRRALCESVYEASRAFKSLSVAYCESAGLAAHRSGPAGPTFAPCVPRRFAVPLSSRCSTLGGLGPVPVRPGPTRPGRPDIRAVRPAALRLAALFETFRSGWSRAGLGPARPGPAHTGPNFGAWRSAACRRAALFESFHTGLRASCGSYPYDSPRGAPRGECLVRLPA